MVGGSPTGTHAAPEQDPSDAEYLKHPKYGAFFEDVINVLKAFDKAKEWADLIKCLQRLGKALQKYPNFPIVPAKLTFAKRLSQCLNPALPSGVHLKALETFEEIFVRMGANRLAKDISIYSAGLFPLFNYASMQVKPPLLQIYEKFYLPLGHELFPCLNGFVTALLPGIEEEGSEFFGRVMTLLDNLCQSTDRTLFFRAMWKSLLQSAHARLPALNYLVVRLPAIKNSPNISEFIPDREGLVLRALIAGLQDTNILVQRTTLEVITTHFRVHEGLFEGEEWVTLMTACLGVVIRREMSLNRRLYSWILGPNEEQMAEYFTNTTKDIVIQAVKRTFKAEPTDVASATRPFKVLMALLDKEEIGSAIIEDLLVDVLRPLLKYKDGHMFFREISTSVTQIIDALQPRLLWESIGSLLVTQLDRLPQQHEQIEALSLMDCLLDNLSLTDTKTQTTFLPSMLERIVTGLSTITRAITTSPNVLEKQVIAGHLFTALQLAMKVIGKIYPPEISDQLKHSSNSIATDDPTSLLLGKVAVCRQSYEDYFALLVDQILPNCGGVQTDEANWDSSTSAVYLSVFDLSCQLLVTFHTYFHKTSESQAGTPSTNRKATSEASKQAKAENTDVKLEDLPKVFENVTRCCMAANPQIACFGIHTFISFISGGNTCISKPLQKRLISSRAHMVPICKKLWSMSRYSSKLSGVHYKVANLLLKIRPSCEDVICTVIADDLLQQDVEKRVDGYQRFGLIWRLTGEISSSQRVFSNSLFLMLDALSDEQPLVRLAGRTWLADSINKVERILDPLLLVLLDSTTVRSPDNFYQTTYDARRVLYILRILRDIIECDFRLFMQHVVEKPVSKDIQTLNQKQVVSILGESSDLDFAVESYIDLLVITALRFIQGRVPANSPPEFVALNSVVQTTSAEFLQYFMLKITVPSKAISLATKIQEPILQNLASSVSSSNLVLQVQLLALLRSIVQLYARNGNGLALASAETNNLASAIPSSLLSTTLGVDPIDEICRSPMFLQTIVIGILQQSSKNIRVYWLEFLTTCLPYFFNHLAALVTPIVNCICDILIGSFENPHDSVSSKDVLLLLRTLCSIFQLCTQNAALIEKTLDDQNNQKSAVPGRFLVDFVKERMWTSETGNSELHPQLLARQELFRAIPHVLLALLKVWGQPRSTGVIAKNPFALPTPNEELHNKYNIQDQVLKLIDPLMQAYPTQLLGGILQIWSQCRTEPKEKARQRKAVLIEMLNTSTTTTHETILHAAAGILTALNQAKAKALTPPKDADPEPFTDMTVLGFVNTYTRFCVAGEGKSAAAWPSLITLIREGLASSPYACLPLLSILDNYVHRSTQALEDKRLKRELHDLTQKLVDSCVAIAVKTSLEGTSGVLEDDDDDQSAQLQSSDFFAMQPPKKLEPPKRLRSSSTTGSSVKLRSLSNPSASLVSQLSSRAFSVLTNKVPSLLDVLFNDDKDRVASVFAGVVYPLLPFLRKPSLSYHHANLSIGLIAALCDYPYCLRAWRKEVLDIFNDQDFFLFDHEAIGYWKKVINHLMTKDKTAFADVLKMLNRYLTAHQSLMFVSVEQENHTRANLLKRLAFIIYSGEFDQYINSLPQIQEKLVEALKVPQASFVYIQVFLCMRVLLTRMSRDKLRAFWPVILTEMMRVFGNPNQSRPPLVLAACKFLDLVLILPPEQFNVYEWMFITDCFEHVGQQKLVFVPYIEQLAQQGRNSMATCYYKLNPPNPISRQPQIVVKGIDDMEQLTMYLQKFSQYAYLNCISGTAADLTFIDSLLGLDFLEGAVEVEHPPSDASHRRMATLTPSAPSSTSTAPLASIPPPTSSPPVTPTLVDFYDIDQSTTLVEPSERYPSPSVTLSSPLVRAAAESPSPILERADIEPDSLRSISTPILHHPSPTPSPPSSSPLSASPSNHAPSPLSQHPSDNSPTPNSELSGRSTRGG